MKVDDKKGLKFALKQDSGKEKGSAEPKKNLGNKAKESTGPGLKGRNTKLGSNKARELTMRTRPAVRSVMSGGK
jgi:hypothetical protein